MTCLFQSLFKWRRPASCRAGCRTWICALLWKPLPHQEALHELQALQLACERLRLTEVANGLAALNQHTQQDLQCLLGLLCPSLCTAFFPRYMRPSLLVQPACPACLHLHYTMVLNVSCDFQQFVLCDCSHHVCGKMHAQNQSTGIARDPTASLADCIGVPK